MGLVTKEYTLGWYGGCKGIVPCSDVSAATLKSDFDDIFEIFSLEPDQLTATTVKCGRAYLIQLKPGVVTGGYSGFELPHFSVSVPTDHVGLVNTQCCETFVDMPCLNGECDGDDAVSAWDNGTAYIAGSKVKHGDYVWESFATEGTEGGEEPGVSIHWRRYCNCGIEYDVVLPVDCEVCGKCEYNECFGYPVWATDPASVNWSDWSSLPSQGQVVYAAGDIVKHNYLGHAYLWKASSVEGVEKDDIPGDSIHWEQLCCCPTQINSSIVPRPIEVTVANNTNSTVTVVTNDVVYGDDFIVDIVPDTGYRLESVTVDVTDYNGSVSIDGNRVTITSVKEPIFVDYVLDLNI